MHTQNPLILAIESSCDDTSAAVLQGRTVLSNLIANQEVHAAFGGVMPEAASRAHLNNILAVVDVALNTAGLEAKQLDAIAYTQGPGLIGSLLVGTHFAQALSFQFNKPLIAIHHMHAHVLAHFIDDPLPECPFLCLTVSGGHTQLVLVKSPYDLEVIGTTIDDAAGEAFDKCAKMLGLPYPGGPLVDKHAKLGNPNAFQFAQTNLPNLDFSFSGFKTSVLYFLQKQNPEFIQANLNDLCASIQKGIIDNLMRKALKAMEMHNLTTLAIAGGVSANSGLRNRVLEECAARNWQAKIPQFQYCTDNAAMIGISAYFKYLKQDFATFTDAANPRLRF